MARRINLFCLMALLAFGTLPMSNRADPASDWTGCKNGRILTAEEEQAAISACTSLIESRTLNNVDLGAAYHWRAQHYDDVQHYASAIDDYTRVITLANDPEALSTNYMQRGFAKEKNGDKSGCQADEAKARDLDPKGCSMFCWCSK